MSEIRQLTADLQIVAVEELNEVPSRLLNDLDALKAWIDQQPHLKARKDNQFLLAFLRGCKFSLEKAKLKIDNYYSLRTKYPNFYTIQNLDDPWVLELIKMGIGLYLPTPLYENGPRILFIRTGAYPAEKYSFENVMCMAHTLQQIIMMEDDYAVINGFVQILDMSQATYAHMMQMTPTIMKKMTVFAEEAVPLRQKSLHIINTPLGFDKVFNVLKPLMPTKQQERLYIHGNNLETMYEHIPQKYLPKEYGGENGSIDELIKRNLQKYFDYRNFFMDDLKYGTDENFRQRTLVEYDNDFGVDGSFRKLMVD